MDKENPKNKKIKGDSKNRSARKQNNKNKNEKDINRFEGFNWKRFLKYIGILALVLGFVLYPLIKSAVNKVFPEKKKYSYTEFIEDLKQDKIGLVEVVTGSEKAKIILKTEERIQKEKEIKEKVNSDKNIADTEKRKEVKKQIDEFLKQKEEEVKKIKQENKGLYQEKLKGLEERTKEVIVPTINSFSDFMQNKITEGTNVEFIVKDIPAFIAISGRILSLLPTILFAVLIYFTVKMYTGGKGEVYEDIAHDSDVKFKDIAGLDEEREQLMEIVDFLKNPKDYMEMGAKIPRGVLLYGDPGTGKTLIAKAIAGEAGVPFISMSGSEFIEMFAGLGAHRVRKLFDKARKLAPAIIFIDEIDAIGARRSGGGGSETENNQTLNQLLVEMDGFKSENNTIVIAATNRPEILDKALLRPGRFDRQIIIPAPDIKGREEILKLHAEKKKIAKDVSFKEIAAQTAGFTGAELANVLNEAAILATRNKRKAINMSDIEEAMRKVTIGLEKQNRVMSEKDKKITAYHEAGHAVVSHMLETQDDVKEITIVPRGMAGGYTMYKQTEDKTYISKRELEEDMISLLGGRAAEDIIIKDVTTGASNDIERATKIARNMIIIYGMSEKLGPISLSVQSAEELKLYGNDITKEIGKEVQEKVEKAFIEARKILVENIDILHEVAQTLLEKEKIDDKEFVQVVDRCLEKRNLKEDNNK